MAIETLGLPDPASPNVNDGAQVYDLSAGFATAVDGNALGVEWFTPLSAPGVTPVVKWWRVSDQSLIASKSFVAVAGTRQQVMFDAPVAVAAGEYRVSVETIFFTLTSSWGGWPASSANLLTDTPDGWLSVGPGFPNDGPRTALYHVSPIWEAGGEPEPAEGTAALGLELAVAATGARASAAAAALGAQLAVAAAGARDSAGAAAPGLELAVAAAGARSSRGAAAAGLTLTVHAVGSRPSVGSAALGLALAVAAEGPGAGQVQRPAATAVPRPSTAAVPRPSL